MEKKYNTTHKCYGIELSAQKPNGLKGPSGWPKVGDPMSVVPTSESLKVSLMGFLCLFPYNPHELGSCWHELSSRDCVPGKA